MVLMECPYVKFAYPEIRATRDDGVEIVTVVETDLELDALQPGYDQHKVNKLLEAVQAYIRSNPSVDNVSIRTKR